MVADPDELILDLDGYEGPIGLLLNLARDQKVDLRRISILALADQYLAFIAAAERLRLELAADYLVMAAWLAYLKSRLLLPDPPEDDEPSGAELAEALEFRLRRLAAMQEAGQALLARPRLGQDVFGRGAAVPGEGDEVRVIYAAGLGELLASLRERARHEASQVLQIRPPAYVSVEDALARLANLVGHIPDWRRLEAFLPAHWRREPLGRSTVAATFAASLELAKAGRIELRQDQPFGPIWLRSPAPLQ